MIMFVMPKHLSLTIEEKAVLSEKRMDILNDIHSLHEEMDTFKRKMEEKIRIQTDKLKEIEERIELTDLFTNPEVGYSKATVKGINYWMGRVKIPKTIRTIDGKKPPRYISFIVGDENSLPNDKSIEFLNQLNIKAIQSVKKKFKMV